MIAFIPQADADAASVLDCDFLLFWSLEIVKYVSKKTRISAGSRFSHPEQDRSRPSRNPSFLKCIFCDFEAPEENKSTSR
jgi:hypothetical protein